MGRPAGWTTMKTGRPAQKSPGRPKASMQRHGPAFWAAIATGATTEDAARVSGVSTAVGCRWFRQCGGMPPSTVEKPTGRYLSFAEREHIAAWRSKGCSMREIARRLGRAPSTISRELRRNSASRGAKLEYRASVAQWHRDRAAERPKASKLATNSRLRDYVQDRLSGKIKLPDGRELSGPSVPWKGRRHGRRTHRRWGKSWSPEQIANRLPIDYPGDESMRVSHEAVYQGLYIRGRGSLQRASTACLRTGRALRVPRVRASRQKKTRRGFVTSDVLIDQRPTAVADREEVGHWEGDLIIGLDRSAIGTLVERKTRFTILLHLPRLDGFGLAPRVHNGPALAGLGAEAVRDAIIRELGSLPVHLRKTLTWDQGSELSRHAELRLATDLAVYFCHPHSPWQRGTNENTNGLLRQFFPKGTDLSMHSADDLAAVAAVLNDRPRKVLGFQTPAEVLDLC